MFILTFRLYTSTHKSEHPPGCASESPLGGATEIHRTSDWTCDNPLEHATGCLSTPSPPINNCPIKSP